MPGLRAEPTAHVVGHQLHVIADFRHPRHLRALDEILPRARRDGYDALCPQRVAQSLKQKRKILPVARVAVNARGIVAGIFPVNVDPVKPRLLYIRPARLRKRAPPFLRERHGRKPARAPSAHAQNHLERGIERAKRAYVVDVRELMRIQKPVLPNQSEGDVHVRKPLRVVRSNADQRAVDHIGQNDGFRHAECLLHQNRIEKERSTRRNWACSPVRMRQASSHIRRALLSPTPVAYRPSSSPSNSMAMSPS